jgi:hypothetical protein
MTTRKTSPAAAEALGEAIPLTFAGIDFLVPTTSNWPLTALLAYEDGKIATFVRALLGAEQFAAYLATSPVLSDMNEFVEALQKALGISGN